MRISQSLIREAGCSYDVAGSSLRKEEITHTCQSGFQVTWQQQLHDRLIPAVGIVAPDFTGPLPAVEHDSDHRFEDFRKIPPSVPYQQEQHGYLSGCSQASGWDGPGIV